jgi:iron complex outermembrane receptor protein
MTRHLIFGLLAIGALACAQTGTSLSGKVTDPSGAVVPAANVRLYSRDNAIQRNTQSSAEGEFLIDRVPAGEYLLEARTQGLDQASPVAVVLKDGERAQVELKLDLNRLSTRVLVTASSTPLMSDEAGKAMDVIDSGEIARRGEITLIESLRQMPGFRVQQLGSPGSFARIQTRGLRAADTAVTIDGMRFRDGASVQGDATAFLGDLLVVNSDRVEVLRGSGSSLYGSNAIGGVVNLVTDQGGGPLRGELSGEGGGLGMFRGLGRFSGGLKEDRIQYSGGVAQMNVNGGIDDIESVNNTSGQGFLQWRPTGTSALSGRVMGFRSDLGLTTTPGAAPDSTLPPGAGPVRAIPLPQEQILLGDQGQPFAWGSATFSPNFADPDANRLAEMWSSQLAWNQQVTPRLNYRLAWQGLNTQRGNRNGPLGLGYQPFGNSNDFYSGRYDTLQARADIAAARWNLASVGYEWEREAYDNHLTDTAGTDARTTIQQRSHALYFQDLIRTAGDRLTVSVSGRWQHFNLNAPTFAGGAPQYEGAPLTSPKDALTGDVSLAYFVPKSSTKLRAHLGNGYRAPALYERFGSSFFFGSFSAFGDPRLSPERTVSFDFGVDQYFANNRAKVSASYFYTRLQNVIGFGYLSGDPFGRWGGYVNLPGGLARGVELSMEVRPWRGSIVRSSYTYTNADERTSGFTDGSLRAIRVFPQMFTVVASQQIGRRLQVTADFLGASEYISGVFFTGIGSRPYLFPGPRKLDLSASYDLPVGEQKTLRFFTRAENLTNQRYFEDGFRTPRVWATGGMKFLF